MLTPLKLNLQNFPQSEETRCDVLGNISDLFVSFD